jgi:hypothetical protein
MLLTLVIDIPVAAVHTLYSLASIQLAERVVGFVVGVPMVIFARPFAKWGVSVFFAERYRRGELTPADDFMRRIVLWMTVTYVIVGAAAIAVFGIR